MSADRERIRRIMAGECCCPPAVVALVAADHAAFLKGWRLCNVLHSAEMLAEALMHAHRQYRSAMLIVFADVYVEAEAMGCQLEFPADAPPHPVRTCAPENLPSTDPQRDGRLPLMIEATRRIVERVGAEVPVFASIKDPFSAAALACGAQDFFTLLISDPGRAGTALQVTLENQQKYATALLATGARIIIGAPLASGGLLGPRHFRNFALEAIRQLVQLVKRNSAQVGIHICGDSDPILEQLIKIPAHFFSLEFFDPARWRKLSAALHPRPALMGYFPTELLLQGSEEAIAAEVQRECEALSGVPHILATACDVPQRCPPEKVRCFLKAGAQWRG